MKWFLIIILVCVIMLIANSLSRQYRDKYDFYYNLQQFLNKFKINLGFIQTKVLDFLNETKPHKEFKVFIEAYKTYIETSNLDLNSIKILENDEKKDLEEIITNTGKLNVDGELNQIDAFLGSVEGKLKLAEENKNKICPMILKLSFLFAIGLAVLLI